MSWFAVGAIGGALIGAVSSKKAGDQQSEAQRQAAATQQSMFNTINAQNQPFIQAGYGANTRLQQLLGLGGDSSGGDFGSLTRSFSPQDFLDNKDPGYDFQLRTGGQAIRNADTPGVGSLSGAALKDLMSFNQNMAATGYQNAFNRFTTNQNNIFQRLHDIAGLGQASANNTSAAGTALGTGVAQAQAAAGASQAAGTLGVGQSLASGASTLGGLAYLNSGRGGSSGTPGYQVNDPYGTSGGRIGDDPSLGFGGS